MYYTTGRDVTLFFHYIVIEDGADLSDLLKKPLTATQRNVIKSSFKMAGLNFYLIYLEKMSLLSHAVASLFSQSTTLNQNNFGQHGKCQ